MERSVLRNDQWEAIKDLLPGKSTDCGVTAANNRQFIEAVLWIARTGAPWRDLPENLGNWARCLCPLQAVVCQGRVGSNI